MENIATLLDPHVLTLAYAEREGARVYPMTDEFLTGAGTPDEVPGTEYTMLYDPAEMEPAPLNHPGAEARVLQTRGLQEKHMSLFRAFNALPMHADVLLALREPDSMAMQQKGRTEVNRQLGKYRERHNIQKEQIVSKIMATGKVSVNAKGQVLESTTGAEYTADFGVPSGNQTDIGGIIDALWSVASTDIAAQLDKVKDKAQSNNAPEPTEIWVHTLMKQYLRNNTEFKAWAAYNQESTTTILRGDMIQDLWGFNWHFYGGKYQASDGTKKDFIPQNTAIICPAANAGGWIRPSVGSILVPTEVGIMAGIDEALANSAEMYGPFSYVYLAHNPIMLWMYMGDTFGLHFAQPEALYQATVA